MTAKFTRVGYRVWFVLIVGFAIMHFAHLRADFPNRSPWMQDGAKYTDEGWYGNAAVTLCLTGKWYLAADFNPAVAMPVWPFLEFILYKLTGVTIEAARALAVSVFLINLLLVYLLLRNRGPLWVTLAVLTLITTSPFLYCYSRLATPEFLLIALTLAAINAALCLPPQRHPLRWCVLIGVLIALMMLAKPTAVFLLPAVAWAGLTALREKKDIAVRCGFVAAGVSLGIYGSWLAVVWRRGWLPDYRYLFSANHALDRREIYGPVVPILHTVYNALQVGYLAFPLIGLFAVLMVISWNRSWTRRLLLDPVFGAALLAIFGYSLFCVLHVPELHYFPLLVIFGFIVLLKCTSALVGETGWENRIVLMVLLLILVGACINAVRTLNYASHPQYSFVNTADEITHYIDLHPNGRRLLVADSGDEITLITHLPALCDEFGTQSLASKLVRYQPGWYATWNSLDSRLLEDIHRNYSIEEVATFRAFDREDRDVLVLFKLHPLLPGQQHSIATASLGRPMNADKIAIPILEPGASRHERIRDQLLRKYRDPIRRFLKSEKRATRLVVREPESLGLALADEMR